MIDALDRVLEDSVRVHQRSDVPYGLFLSGGIDSSAIATLMARLNSRPVTAFTCGFDAPDARDERGAAERVARALDERRVVADPRREGEEGSVVARQSRCCHWAQPLPHAPAE